MSLAQHWFEFEVKQNNATSKERLPADNYAEAIAKLRRIYPDGSFDLLREWKKEISPHPQGFGGLSGDAQSVRDMFSNKRGRSRPTEKKRHSEPPPPQKEEPTPTSKPAESPWWEMLGLPEDASLDQAKKAYIHLVKQYHPDKVRDLGPELQELAERKTLQILKAFNDAKKQLR